MAPWTFLKNMVNAEKFFNQESKPEDKKDDEKKPEDDKKQEEKKPEE